MNAIKQTLTSLSLAGLLATTACKTPTAMPEPLVLPELYELVRNHPNANRVETADGVFTYSLKLTGSNNYKISLAASGDSEGRKLLQTTVINPAGWGLTYRDGGVWGGIDGNADYVTAVIPGIDDKKHPSVQINTTVGQLYGDLTTKVSKALRVTTPIATIDLGDLTINPK
ncbi:hypothetical protein J4208_03300 [Candidatus Woesearchaeota archaeon]|nr:hypothetical protein [Candidatus Woesearchaeota archaeon]